MSNTFSNCEKFISCDTTPNIDFACATFSSRSIPKIFTLPDDFVTKVPIIPMVDDLPAPFGPSKA